jgi:branched-chain amino acid transport system substrate-binding protein
MSDGPEKTPTEQDEPSFVEGKSYSRREFLKIAGIAGATVGVGAGLGGLIAACGGTTTTTAGATTTTAGATTTTAGATTTVSAAAETGREIKIGFVTPQTGGLAAFGVPDMYCVGRWREAIGDGLVLGDGKMHPISITVADSQSDNNRAAQVAGDLINNDQVDIMTCASTPSTVLATVEQCEAYATPVVSTDCPWQVYLRGDPANNEYKWSYHVFFGSEDFLTVNEGTWAAIPNNKTVGLMCPNDEDGIYYRKAWPPFLDAKGYKYVDGGAYQNGMEDFTSIISAFKSGGCELITGVVIPPDFTNFWAQCAQQGYLPKVCTVGKAILFPESVDALGNNGNGICSELWWHPVYPFKSSLTGETCQQFADDYAAKTGNQPTAPLLHYMVGEWAIYALKNATDPTSKDSILAAIEKTKFDTLVGPVDFTGEVMAPGPDYLFGFTPGPGRKHKNVWDHGLAEAQWLMLGGKYKFDEIPVNNAAAPYLTSDLLQAPKALPIT